MVLDDLRPARRCAPSPPGRSIRAVALRCLLALLLGLHGPPSLAQEVPAPRQPAPLTLSLAEAQAAAMQRSQALPAQAAAADAARQRAVAAAQRPDPVLRLGLDNVPVEGGGPSLLTREATTARSLGLVQALPDADKRKARAQVYEREADQALARRALAARSVAREAGLAWFSVRAALQRLQVIDAQQLEADQVQEAADAAYRAGRGSQADLFAARAARVRLDDQRLQAEAQRDRARAGLRRWVGDAADRPLADAPRLDRLWPGQVVDDDPELQLATARERQAAAAADVAREERRADWSVDLRFQQRGPRFDNMMSLGLSLPLRWDLANRQDRELDARLALLRQAEADRTEVQRSRDAELERWQLRWRSGLARLQLHDAQRQPLAHNRVQAALSAYRAGSGALLAVLEARQAVLTLQLDRVQVELEVATDWLRLETLTLKSMSTPSVPQEKQP
jgi:outer membrane protein, heavy metal efflux system